VQRTSEPKSETPWVLEEVLVASWGTHVDVDVREIDKTIRGHMDYLESLPPADTIQYFRFVVRIHEGEICLFRQKTRTRS
jgi:hypothetical protein